MPVDSSIYFQQAAPDLLGGIQKGLTMRDMLTKQRLQDQQIAEQKTLKDLMKSSTTVAPDGTVSVDRQKLMGGLNQAGMTDQALAMQKQFSMQDAEHRKMALEGMDMMGRVLGPVKDQAGWSAARADLIKSGLVDQKNLPEAYDPTHTQMLLSRSMTYKDQLSKELSQRDEVRKDRELAIKEREASAKIAKEKAGGENLPLDKKTEVKSLAETNAKKTGIRSQIDAVIDNWENLPDDQKVAAGRQLIKTLNSTEGSDAVGAEEARRLGGKLEFAMGNLTNSNPIQFGRDLAGFKEQAKNVSAAIGRAIKANQDIIDKTMGRKVKAEPAKSAYHDMSDDELVRLYQAAGGK